MSNGARYNWGVIGKALIKWNYEGRYREGGYLKCMPRKMSKFSRFGWGVVSKALTIWFYQGVYKNREYGNRNKMIMYNWGLIARA